jgi:hypothetical protein
MWHKNIVKSNLYYGKEVASRKEIEKRSLEIKESPLLDQFVAATTSEHGSKRSDEYDTETYIRIIQGKYQSLEYARWMDFVRHQRQRKKKLPSGPNRKWIAWQQKQKEMEAAKAAFDPFQKRKKATLLQQSMKMLALDDAKEANKNVHNLNEEIINQVEKITARGEETKEQYSMNAIIKVDKRENENRDNLDDLSSVSKTKNVYDSHNTLEHETKVPK